MSARRTAKRITAACEECGRTTGDRVITEDGYTFQRQPDGTWTDGDMTFSSLDEIESQVGVKFLGPQASATKVINGVASRLKAAIEKEAMWQSTLHENYDGDFGQWLVYSDMHGLAGRLGFTTAEEAWKANPTVQGSTDPTDFKIVPEGEQMDMELSAALSWTCESCGSDTEPGVPCDCMRRPEARQPALKAMKAARVILDMGDLVISESPPNMGGMDIHRKVGEGDLEKITFLNERGMDELGEWITNASRIARIAILTSDDTGRPVRRPPAKPMSVDRDVDTEGMELETCPRCKGHGGVFPADEGEDCNLCDGNGEVFSHPDGSYSNETDRNTYLY